MAPPPKPKGPRVRPPSPGGPTAPPRRHPTLELPFSDDEVLHEDDPRPQRVPQYPAEALPARRAAPRKQEEAIPTKVYDFSSEDEELAAPWDAGKDGGEHKPAFLYVEKGPGQGQLVPVPQGPMVIGRASISELRLQHPSVSRRHAQLTRLGERFYLKDLGSQNATFVNRVRLEAEVEIYPGDLLQVGSATIKLRGPAEQVPADTRRKLDKVQSAARKSGPKPQAVRTQPHAIPAGVGARRNTALLAVACVGIGVGLAAIALLAWKVLQPGPTYQPLAQGGDVQVEASQPIVAAAPSAEERVNERIAQQMEKSQPAAAAAPAAQPAAASTKSAPKPVAATRAASPAPAPAPRKTEPAPTRTVVAAAAPAKSAAPSKTEILKLYEAGDVSGAITAAKQAGDADLARKLTEFQTASAAGDRGMKANDAGAAVAGYKRALAVDETISGGWGTHGPLISKKLGQIYAQYGQHLMSKGETDAAQTAFRESLKYDPQNASAKAGLAGVASGAAPKGRAAAIDDAWGDEEPVPAQASTKSTKPAAAKKPAAEEDRKSSLDEAWGD